jgi:HEAT repeat protein
VTFLLVIASVFSIQSVLPKLHSVNYEERLASLTELSQIKDNQAIPEIVKAIEEEAKYPRPYLEAVTVSGQITCGNDEYLILQRRAQNEVTTFREKAVRALVRYGASAFPHRIGGLKNPDEAIRLAYIVGQKEAKDPEAFSILLAEAEKKSRLQMAAYFSVIAYQDPRARELYLKTLKSFGHSNPVILSGAVDALARLKDASAVTLLSDLSRNKYAEIRLKALHFLDRFKTPQALEAILDRLHDPKLTIRLTAVEIAGKYPEPDVLKIVSDSLKTETDFEFQYKAIETLKKIGNQETVRVLEPLISSSHEGIRRAAQSAILTLRHKN